MIKYPKAQTSPSFQERCSASGGIEPGIEMRKLFYLVLILLIFACKSSRSFYHGYVYNSNGPLNNVQVKEDMGNSNSTFTDSTGYFKLNKNTYLLNNLVFIKEGFKIDTIKTVWSQHGERLEYMFLNKKEDTIYLKPIKSIMRSK